MCTVMISCAVASFFISFTSRAPRCGTGNTSTSLPIRGPLTAQCLLLRCTLFSRRVSKWQSLWNCSALFVKYSHVKSVYPVKGEEADQKSTKPFKAASVAVQSLQAKVWRELLPISVRLFTLYKHWTVFFIWDVCRVLMMLSTDSGYTESSSPLSFSRDDHSFNKPGFGTHKYHQFTPRASFHQSFHTQKHHHTREREKEKERYEQRESTDGSSPSKLNTSKFICTVKSGKTVTKHRCLFRCALSRVVVYLFYL